MKKQLSFLVSTGLYIGLVPGAPGTYASLATAAAFYLVLARTHGVVPQIHLSIVCLISAAGIFASAETSRQRGDSDPSVVVVDEIAGQLLTYLFVPVSWTNLVAGFVLFRLFDIWKPPPIRRLERLSGGVGIMADDLAAGVYANLLLHLLNWALGTI
jgi:phosphatidylglycerophosphatase A